MKPLWPSHYIPPCKREDVFLTRASSVLGVSIREIRLRCRKREYTWRRFAIAHVMRNSLNYSYSQIAKTLGLKDHTTIINAVEKSRILVTRYPSHASMVDALEMVT